MNKKITKILNNSLLGIFIDDVEYEQQMDKTYSYIKSECFLLKFENDNCLTITPLEIPQWKLKGELDIEFTRGINRFDENYDLSTAKCWEKFHKKKLVSIRQYYQIDNFLDRLVKGGKLVQIEFIFENQNVFSLGFYRHNDDEWSFIYSGEIGVTLNKSLNSAGGLSMKNKLLVRTLT